MLWFAAIQSTVWHCTLNSSRIRCQPDPLRLAVHTKAMRHWPAHQCARHDQITKGCKRNLLTPIWPPVQWHDATATDYCTTTKLIQQSPPEGGMPAGVRTERRVFAISAKSAPRHEHASIAAVRKIGLAKAISSQREAPALHRGQEKHPQFTALVVSQHSPDTIMQDGSPCIA